MEFHLTLYALLESLPVNTFFPQLFHKVIKHIKDLPINILSPTFTVTNYNKNKHCISHQGFR